MIHRFLTQTVSIAIAATLVLGGIRLGYAALCPGWQRTTRRGARHWAHRVWPRATRATVDHLGRATGLLGGALVHPLAERRQRGAQSPRFRVSGLFCHTGLSPLTLAVSRL